MPTDRLRAGRMVPAMSIGEGFAYFRWHSLTWPDWDECRGINDKRVCALYWTQYRGHLVNIHHGQDLRIHVPKLPHEHKGY